MGDVEELAARLILGTVLLVSGSGKLFSSTSLADGIMEYKLLSRAHARALARLLPPAELILAVACLAGIALPLAASFVAGLLLVFTAAIGVNLARGRRFDCHCFAGSRGAIGPSLIARNVALIALAIFVASRSLFRVGRAAVADQWQPALRELSHPDIVAALVGTVILVLAILFLVSEVEMEPLTSGRPAEHER
ncbi:MAG: MauE/DoxX family redox-associated membrane protein [Chloroflexota bacterium]